MVKTVAVILFALSGWLFMQFAPVVSETDGKQFAEKVNLALRRTAHHLLAEGGDSTSRISPVQHPDARTYYVQLDRPIDYDRIPPLLQESLKLHQIEAEYNVAILNCNDGIIQLGYSVKDLTDKGVACVGRQGEIGCRVLQITFLEAGKPVGNAGWAGLFGFLLAGISGLMWYRVAKVRDKSTTVAADRGDGSQTIRLGQIAFNHAEQSLNVAGTNQPLTYRESKLLNLFATHPNQLLERERILKLVWEDENIIVGRSLDVFVSRLRKLLRNDPSVRIVSVHGVGYRLEVD